MSEIKKREATLGIAVGQKGVGKTYKTLEMMQPILRGNPRTGAKPRKVLILDVNNEFSDIKSDQNPNFANARAIAVEDVKKWCYNGIIECRRVSTLKQGGGQMTLKEISTALGLILESFQNGLLLIEDPTKFISDSLPADLIGAICTQRHKSCDLILHFQSIGKMAHPKLWANCNWLRFHKTKDTIEKHEKKFGTDVKYLCIAQKLVDMKFDKGDKRFVCFLDTEKENIRGNFNALDFKEAINLYLQENYVIIEKEVKKRNVRTGDLVHKDYAVAYNFVIDNYMKDFYGNPK